MWPYLAEYKTKKLFAPCLKKVLVFKKTMKHIKRGQFGNSGKAIPNCHSIGPLNGVTYVWHRREHAILLGSLHIFWHCCFYWNIFKHDNVGMKSFDVKGDMEPMFIQCHVIGVHFEPCLGTVLGPCYGHFGLIGPLLWQLGLCCTHVRLMSGLNRQTILKQKCHPPNDIKFNINCNSFRSMHAHNFFLAPSVWRTWDCEAVWAVWALVLFGPSCS